jgi:hypothetical protein
MRRLGKLAWLGLAALLAGCVPASLHPLCSEQDAVLVPTLAGKYVDEADGASWTFTQGESKAYKVTITQENELATYQAYVTNLGTYMFLDLLPAPTELEEKAITRYAYQPLHVHFLAKLEGDTLQLALVDTDWLEAQLEQGKVKVNVETPEDSVFIVLTSPTKELREFFLEAARNPDAFTEFAVLKRVK